MNFKTYINRIRYMSPMEVSWRLRELCTDKIDFWSRRQTIPPLKHLSVFRPMVDMNQINMEECIGFWNKHSWHQDLLDDLKTNRFHCIFDTFDLGPTINWHYDPTTETQLPLVFGRKYLFLKMYKMANMQFIRALNRHYHFVHLAKGIRLGKCRPSILKDQITDWIRNNPYLEGINWSDSLDVAIRLFNWSLTFSIADILLEDSDFLFQVQQSVFLQATFIEKHLSHFSSANNHLLGEYIGLAIAGLCLPEMPKANNWLLLGKKGIEREILNQWAFDGIHREQSFSYHCWLLEHLLVIYAAFKRLAEPFNKECESRLSLGLEYVANCLNAENEVLFFGDCGHEATTDMHYMSFKSTNCWVSLLRLGYHLGLYHGDDYDNLSLHSDERTCWIVPSKSNFRSIPAIHVRNNKRFDDSGIFFLRDKQAFDQETCIVFRCGPMGYLGTCAHAHADQLSFVLSVRGTQMLIDPGTYGYYFKGDNWRHYFRGTSAHNTIMIDEKDQAESGGNMIWLKKANGKLLKWVDDDEVIVKGEHDGYCRLKDPVRHIRQISLQRGKKRIEIRDEIRSQAEHVLDFFLHIHPDASVNKNGDHLFTAIRGGRTLNIYMDRSLAITRFFGNEENPMGWYSPFFGVKLPCVTLRGCYKGVGNRNFNLIMEYE